MGIHVLYNIYIISWHKSTKIKIGHIFIVLEYRIKKWIDSTSTRIESVDTYCIPPTTTILTKLFDTDIATAVTLVIIVAFFKVYYIFLLLFLFIVMVKFKK
jgi:hypothetical protein